jgi:hypothetical protein
VIKNKNSEYVADDGQDAQEDLFLFFTKKKLLNLIS